MSDAKRAPITYQGGRLAVLAIDQRDSLRHMLAKAKRPAEDDDLKQFKVDVITALSAHSSAVLTDLEYGVLPLRRNWALPDGVGLLIAAEPAQKKRYRGEYLTTTEPGHDASWVRANRGDALKFAVRWDPDRVAVDGEPNLTQIALDVVRDIVADCVECGIPSVIEPLVSFAPGKSPSQAEKEAAVVRSAVRLAPLGMDLLKLEWPGGGTACAAVTEGLRDVPWALLSAGVSYPIFLERVAVALENGAVGVIAGRAIWGEAVEYDGKDRWQWLQDVAVRRMQTLANLVREHTRSWRDIRV